MIGLRWFRRLPLRKWDRWTVIRSGLLLGYVLLFSTLSILKWATFLHFDADLAINDQLAWTASRFMPFRSSLIDQASFALGDHFSFTLVYHAPLYWLWADPRMLLIAQTITIALAVLPIVWIADKRLGSRAAATMIGAAFLLHPALHNVNLFEFHESAPAIPVLAWLFWAIETRRTRTTLFIALLFLTVKEEMSIIGVAVGLYIAIATRQYRLGAAIAILSATWGVLVMGLLMPRLNDVGGGFYYVRRYSQYGNSTLEIALTLITRPWILMSDLFGPGRPVYFWNLLAPFALLPLASPAVFAVAVPPLVYLSLGNSPAQYSIDYHYQAPILPILAVALIAGLARLQQWRVPVLASAGVVLLAAIGFAWYLSPVPPARLSSPAVFAYTGHSTLVQRVVDMVPKDASISAARNVVSRFSRRSQIYNFPRVNDAEYVLLHYTGQVCCHVFDDDGGALGTFVKDPRYYLAFAEDGVWLYRKGTQPDIRPSQVLDAVFSDEIRLLGSDYESGRVTLWWQALRPADDRYAVFFHVLNSRGERVQQNDSEPLEGLMPTNVWPVGRPMPDVRTIDRRTLPPGDYRVVVGLYEWGGGDRLISGGRDVQDGSVQVATFHVP